ncbi:TolC family protein [Mucilaginibacter sp. KACC 22063]|uniref:TolC family protein n=1 Tax=Mucilaginibacter sp. KACC 22063 TaxID=3025666 RepID=UPI002365A4D6|nr:TolC family protein [Mucilaginibacter sp. KACC 22063]WDF53689.1 TolC family protein [Mucilaginibacter sp. KACC 22063]
MKRIYTLILSVLGLLFLYQPLKAQESIIPDINEAYLNKLIEVSKANYPRVRANQNRVSVAKENISKAKISYLDAFTISYVYQPHSATIVATPGINTTGTSSTTTQSYSYFNGLQVGLFFNPGYFFQKPATIRQAKAELQVAQSESDEYMLTLTNEVKKRYYLYIQRTAEVKLQTQSAMDAAELVKSIRHKFEKGEETYDNYNKAQATLSDRNQSRILAETNLLIAKSDLEEILGDKLENIK